MDTIYISFEKETVEAIGYITDRIEGDYNTPTFPAWFDIRKVMYKGVDIFDLLIEMKSLTNLERHIHEKLNK